MTEWDKLAENLADRAAIATIIAVDESLIQHIDGEIQSAERQQRECETDGSFNFSIAARGWEYYAAGLATLRIQVRSHQTAAKESLDQLKETK